MSIAGPRQPGERPDLSEIAGAGESERSSQIKYDLDKHFSVGLLSRQLENWKGFLKAREKHDPSNNDRARTDPLFYVKVLAPEMDVAGYFDKTWNSYKQRLIFEKRNNNIGPETIIDELLRVKTIDPGKFQEFESFITNDDIDLAMNQGSDNRLSELQTLASLRELYSDNDYVDGIQVTAEDARILKKIYDERMSDQFISSENCVVASEYARTARILFPDEIKNWGIAEDWQKYHDYIKELISSPSTSEAAMEVAANLKYVAAREIRFGEEGTELIMGRGEDFASEGKARPVRLEV